LNGVLAGGCPTPLACEETGRTSYLSYLMKPSPQYCDVIVQRWREIRGEETQA
jgi:hypothetical protein